METLINPNWKTGDVQEIVNKKNYIAAYDSLRKNSPSLPKIFRSEVTIETGRDEKLLLVIDPGIYILDIFLKENSKLDFSFLNQISQDGYMMLIARFNLDSGSLLHTNLGVFGGAHSSIFLETELHGENSEVNERTVFWSDGSQIMDIFSTTTHFAPNSRSHIESKGIAHENSAVRFDGKIHITQPARGSNAKLLEHTLLLSPNAKMNAVPCLTIDTNDVIASHSASMTRVDDEQLFYCQSRGIPQKEGMCLIAEGFIKSVELPETFMEKINPLIESKLKKL